MAKLLNLEGVKYVLNEEKDLPAEEQTVFHIRPMKMKERAQVQDGSLVTEIEWAGPKNQGGKGVMRHLTGTQQRLALDLCLEKIENLKDSDGTIIIYNKEIRYAEREKVLDRIPPEWTKEVADRILILSGLTKEEEKN